MESGNVAQGFNPSGAVEEYLQCRKVAVQLQRELQLEPWVGAQARGHEGLALCRTMGLGARVRKLGARGHGRN